MEQTIQNNQRVALVDSDFIPFYVCHNKKEDGVNVIEKTFDECKALCDDFIKNILIQTKATHYIMAFTVGKCFRYRVNPQYKANRKYDQVIPFLKETKDYLIEAYKGVYERDWLEADDIVNILNHRVPNSFIVSPDKDILKLFGRHFNPRKMEWMLTKIDESYFEFWSSMITGDTTDNIKGIPGKGIAFVKKLTTRAEPFDFRLEVLDEYISHFGESEGIDEFYKNYKTLKILSEDESFVTPKLQVVKIDSKEETLGEID